MHTINAQENWYKKYFKCIIIAASIFIFIWIIGGPVLGKKSILKILMKEDRLIEILSAFAYLAGAVIAFLKVKKFVSKGLPRFYWLLPVAGIMGFLEETSFGWTFFKYYERIEVHGKKIDSLHDFVIVALNILRENLPDNVVLLIAAAVLITAIIIVIILRKQIIDFIKVHHSFGLILIGGAFIMIAAVIDLELFNISKYGFATLSEEIFEFNAACAILYSALSIPGKNPEIKE
jgi:hypothetical protein